MQFAKSHRVVSTVICITALLLLTGSGDGACDPEPEGDPPSDEIKELLDVLRTADEPGCERDGEGWPLEECPRGCESVPNPEIAYDAENECRLTRQQLGGPPVCIEEPSDDQLVGGSMCLVDSETESVWLHAVSYYSPPDGWKECSSTEFADFPSDDCDDEET